MRRLLLTFLLALLPATVSAQATPTRLVQASDLVYEGAFRVPDGQGGDAKSFNGGGRALAFNPTNNTLFAVSSECCAPSVAEITIPEIRKATSIAGLAVATYRQPFTEILRGTHTQVNCNDGQVLGGLLPWGSELIASVYCYYDAGYSQVKSHWRLGSDGSFVGPVEIQSPATGGGRAGFVSGYMAPIPAEWQAALGGTALTGNCCLSIITRTSWGPAASAFTPTDIGVKNPVPATALVGYPTEHPLDGDGGCDKTSSLFNCTASVTGVVFAPGTRSVLFIGSLGLGAYCYGQTTDDPAKHLTMNPRVPGEAVCYDPSNADKGGHAYPYAHYVWAYDANDLARVKSGKTQAWQVKPYAVWSFETPFHRPGDDVRGATYDPVTRRLYVSIGEQDAPRPLIHVFRLALDGETPAPQPTPTDAVVSAWSAWAPTGEWSACAAGTQTRAEQRTRTVVTPATNGGTTPALSETRTASQTCTVQTPDPEPPAAVTHADLAALIRQVLDAMTPPAAPTLDVVGCTVTSTTTDTITVRRSTCGLDRPANGATLRVVRE